MTVFGYMRVSTSRQAEEGLSIDVQRQQIEAYGTMNTLPVEVWISDLGISGSVELSQRDGGSRLLAQARAGDVIIASKLDRMFRSASNALNVLEELKERGISLHLIDLGGSVSNGIGQLVFAILSAVAEQERCRIRERIAEAKAKMRREGRYNGGRVAFGYRVADGKLIKNDAEQRCLQMLRKKRDTGFSLRQLSSYVSEEWGMKLSHNAIRNILGSRRKFDSVVPI